MRDDEARSYAEDRAAIEQLEAEYLFAIDWGDAESYAALFAPDGVLEWARGRAVGRRRSTRRSSTTRRW